MLLILSPWRDLWFWVRDRDVVRELIHGKTSALYVCFKATVPQRDEFNSRMLFFNNPNKHHKSSWNYQIFTYRNFQQPNRTTVTCQFYIVVCQKRRNWVAATAKHKRDTYTSIILAKLTLSRQPNMTLLRYCILNNVRTMPTALQEYQLSYSRLLDICDLVDIIIRPAWLKLVVSMCMRTSWRIKRCSTISRSRRLSSSNSIAALSRKR